MGRPGGSKEPPGGAEHGFLTLAETREVAGDRVDDFASLRACSELSSSARADRGVRPPEDRGTIAGFPRFVLPSL